MNMRLLVVACVAMVSGLSGCATARVIKSDPTMVVVSVPDNSNAWPFHYQDEAMKVAGQHIKDPVLVSTNRVKVGESVTSSQNTDRRDLGGQNNKPKFGEITSASSTTSVHDDYEYHLEFQSRQGGSLSQPPMPGGQAFNPPPPGAAPRRDNVDPRLPPVVGSQNNPSPTGFPSVGLPNR